MNVFVLPSWYPSARQPMAGLFAHDQAAAVAAVRPGWRVAVGGWGHLDGALSLRDLRANARALAWRWRARAGWRDVDVGGALLHEHLTPRLSWTLALAGGGVRGLLSASRANLRAAEARFGRMAVLHAHVGFPAGWIATRLAAEARGQGRRLPVLLTEHMGPFPFPALRGPAGGLQPALRAAFEQADATVAVSEALAQTLHAHGLRCDAVVPNVVDDTRFAAVPTPPARTAADPFVFLTLGTLVPAKGMDLLLQALALLPPSLPVQLHIGGDGPEREALQALAASLGLQSRVRWLGALAPAAVPAALAACHAFVLASRHESFGVVLVEALMAGRPVLATRCGGPADIVGPGDGALVAVDDAPALAEVMQALVRGERVIETPATLRERAVARYGRAAVGERVAALLEGLGAGP
ncbi:glycosyltransferase [Rubrivivax rivuli]|nr:glycosyltransferase [Rubrivivax rivuli]